MIAERTLAQAAHAWGAQAVPFSDQPKSELGRTIPVLLLDEAQNYDISALEEIRMLLGLNLPEQPAFALVLVGDPYLLSALRLRSHRALYSRIAAHARIESLSRSEVNSYV